MKKQSFLLSCMVMAIYSSGAFAATAPVVASTSAVPVKPSTVVAVKPATTAATTDVAGAVDGANKSVPSDLMEVNPFTGKPLSYEQSQVNLEKAKMRTAYLEEAYKQANLMADMANIGIKKQLESASAETSILKEKQMQKQAVAPVLPTGALPTLPTPTVSKKVVKKNDVSLVKPSTKTNKTSTTSTESVVSAPVVVAPVGPVIQELQSIISNGDGGTVILGTSQGMAAFAGGADTMWGKVEIVDSRSAMIGGKLYKVHDATLGRFAAEKVAPKATGATVDPAAIASLPPGVISGDAASMASLGASANGIAPTPIGSTGSTPTKITSGSKGTGSIPLPDFGEGGLPASIGQ